MRAFEERARIGGLRAVVMAELARDLGMSTKTLYQHFSTKADLIRALVERWSESIRSSARKHLSQVEDTQERLAQVADYWLTANGRFSPVFWHELERDYPDLHAVFVESTRDLRRWSRDVGARDLRPDLPADLAWALLERLVVEAADPDLCQRLNITRQDAVQTAVELWAQGAMRQRSRLRIVRED
ncbi:MAG: TetR family transcriptional regulator [Proteobacteria bacterium]|nr:TetR family transcriptional regulator [Pseudomonadota bacterium]